MKLVAIWVEKYMALIDKSVNFGDEYTFSFDFDQKKRQVAINANPTKNYFNLHKGTMVSNVSGILGVNGSGKSSLLKLINVVAAKKPLEYGAIFIFKDEKAKKYKIVSQTKILNKNQIEISADSRIGECEVTISKSPVVFSNTDVIFYSSSFSDNNPLQIASAGLINRSVDFLSRSAMNRSDIDKYIKSHKKEKSNVENFDPLSLYYHDRLKRILSFITRVNTDFPGFKQSIERIKLPEFLSIKFELGLYERVDDLIETSGYDFKSLRGLNEFVLSYLQSERDVAVRFEREIIYRVFLVSFLQDDFKKSKTSLSELSQFVKKLECKISVFDKLKIYMSNTMTNGRKRVSFGLSGLLAKIAQPKFRKLFNETRVLDFYTYQLKLNDDTWELILDFEKLINFSLGPIFSYGWYGLSAGQESLLNQFVEIYFGLDEVRSSSVILSIDEGELFLHPEWQRQYVSVILEFLEFFAVKKKNIKSIQIILTSHSPFIACDIPHFNLVYLSEQQSSNNSERTLGEKETFGGNIFSLYKDSFFLDEFFGRFSSKWINKAFDFANGKKDVMTDSDFDGLVKIIGEKVVKQVLEESSKYGKHDFYEVISKDEFDRGDNS